MIGREGLHRDVLLDIVERSGGRGPASYLATGNVSFDLGPGELPAAVEAIETGIEQVVGRETPVFVRTLDRLVELIESDPFDSSPYPEPRDRLVTLVRDRVPAGFELPIVADRGDHHVFATAGAEIFSVTREVDGRTQSPGGVIERSVGEPVTTRAWGTIERIVTKLS